MRTATHRSPILPRSLSSRYRWSPKQPCPIQVKIRRDHCGKIVRTGEPGDQMPGRSVVKFVLECGQLPDLIGIRFALFRSDRRLLLEINVAGDVLFLRTAILVHGDTGTITFRKDADVIVAAVDLIDRDVAGRVAAAAKVLHADQLGFLHPLQLRLDCLPFRLQIVPGGTYEDMDDVAHERPRRGFRKESVSYTAGVAARKRLRFVTRRKRLYVGSISSATSVGDSQARFPAFRTKHDSLEANAVNEMRFRN